MSQYIETKKYREYICRIAPVTAHELNLLDEVPCIGPRCMHWIPARYVTKEEKLESGSVHVYDPWELGNVRGSIYDQKVFVEDEDSDGCTDWGRCGLSS